MLATMSQGATTNHSIERDACAHTYCQFKFLNNKLWSQSSIVIKTSKKRFLATISDRYAFNASQFFDFCNNQDDLHGDSFFEEREESFAVTTVQFQAVTERILDNQNSETESEHVFSPVTDNGPSSSTVYLKSILRRRSLSLNNLPQSVRPPETELSVEVGELSLENTQPQRPNSACCLNTRSNAPSKEHINRLAQPKRCASHDNVSKVTTMTLAEAVVKYQVGTPKRFRSKPSPKFNKMLAIPRAVTKPRSPHLATNQRVRPVTAISHEEREQKDWEEAKKFKIRAHPVSNMVLRGPLKPQVDKKLPTKPVPFHLTGTKQKTPVQEENIVPFKAQPIPKSLHNQQLQKPTTVKSRRTELVPFSFEKRDQELIKKKQEQINKVLEEEKRAREFHARPPPKAILRSTNGSQEKLDEAGSTGSHKRSNEDVNMVFKARQATVLHMKPFEPKKEHHKVEIEEFHFHTNTRIEARHQFEQNLKEKEERAAECKRRQEELWKKQREEEVALLRKQMEVNAQPIKKYKEVVIQPSNKVTQPIPFNFRTDRIRNKENVEG